MTSKAVNVPTDLKAKEKDVNAKLQLYGIYAAFANGKVPSVSSLQKLTRHVSRADGGHRTSKSTWP